MPMPINGSHSFIENYSSGIDDEHPNENRHFTHSQTRRKRNVITAATRSSSGVNYYTNRINSRYSSSSNEENESSNESSSNASLYMHKLHNKRPKLATGEEIHKNKNVLTDARTQLVTPSHERNVELTPINEYHKNVLNFTPDSGITSTMYSGSSSNSTHTNESGSSSSRNNVHSSSSNNSMGANKLFQQKIAKVCRNYSNNFGDDSDSD